MMNALKETQLGQDWSASTPEPVRSSQSSDEVDALLFLGGGERRSEPLTGVKALMLAVLEDGVRCYFSSAPLIRNEAEHWVESRQRKLVFSFEVICETFGIEPSAARKVLSEMRAQRKGAFFSARTRPNVRHNTVSVLRKRRRRRSPKDDKR